MKVTLASVQETIKNKGYEPVQIDGIPEGFSFKKPSITIGGKEHIGEYTAFIPLSDEKQVFSSSMEGLLKNYKDYKNVR